MQCKNKALSPSAASSESKVTMRLLQPLASSKPGAANVVHPDVVGHKFPPSQ